MELRDVEILPIGTLVHKWCFMILAIVPPKSWPLDHVEGVAWLKMATPNLLPIVVDLLEHESFFWVAIFYVNMSNIYVTTAMDVRTHLIPWNIHLGLLSLIAT